jgi:hypothetical protein
VRPGVEYRKDLTAERLREALRYDPDTGKFYRLEATAQAAAGEVVGTPSNGYLFITVEGAQRRAHRLAWLYMTGEWPLREIDHINGDRSDNRFENLRDVTRAINVQNRHEPRAGKLFDSPLGVHFCRSTGKWRAQIGVRGRRVHLGRYASPELAYAAYLDAKRLHHEGCTI